MTTCAFNYGSPDIGGATPPSYERLIAECRVMIGYTDGFTMVI